MLTSFSGRLIGLLVLLAVCVLLALPRITSADPLYTCQFLGHCPDGQVRQYQMDKVGNARAAKKNT